LLIRKLTVLGPNNIPDPGRTPFSFSLAGSGDGSGSKFHFKTQIPAPDSIKQLSDIALIFAGTVKKLSVHSGSEFGVFSVPVAATVADPDTANGRFPVSDSGSAVLMVLLLAAEGSDSEGLVDVHPVHSTSTKSLDSGQNWLVHLAEYPAMSALPWRRTGIVPRNALRRKHSIVFAGTLSDT